MAELVVKYDLDADGLRVEDLIAERIFLAQRLNIPNHLLKVLSSKKGSIMITYWILQDLLPLAELALCRDDVRAELIEHHVKEVCLDCHPSELPSPVSSGGTAHGLCSVVYSVASFLLNCRWTNLCSVYTVRKTQHSYPESCDVLDVSLVYHARCLV